MPRIVFDENFTPYWCPQVNDIDAPRLDEIAAGTNYAGYIPKDGFKLGVTNNRVDDGDISTSFDAELMGTHGAQVEVTFKRGDDVDDDEPWDNFDRLDRGFWVICPFGTAAAGAKAYVLPCQAGQSQPADTAANEQQKFTLPFAVTAAPAYKAVVAASS